MTTNIKGKLVDGIGKPIANAQMQAVATQTSVPIAGATAYAKTDANGDYDFPLEIGNYAFSIWFGELGYQFVGNIETSTSSHNSRNVFTRSCFVWEHSSIVFFRIVGKFNFGFHFIFKTEVEFIVWFEA